MQKAEGLEQLLPFIQEILPRNCTIVMNDEQPSDSYGYAIPFRSTKNPRKDLPVTTGNQAIGKPLVGVRILIIMAINNYEIFLI